MSDVTARDGSWSFDGEALRIVPGGDRRVHQLRKALGELTVPITAVAGVTFETGRKGGRIRLRLREGADPFLHVTAGKLTDDSDPYQLSVDRDSSAMAEYLVDEVRHARTLEQVPSGPCTRYLMPGPAVPYSATAGDATATFDGRRVFLEWNDWAEEAKKSGGARELALTDLEGLEWVPIAGFTNGYLRFRVPGASALPPKNDPNCVTWGMRREGGTISLLAAAVVARLPHPWAPEDEASAAITTGDEPLVVETSTPGGPPDGDNSHDAALRRLRELGSLHQDGILSDDEFTAAKQAVLRRL